MASSQDISFPDMDHLRAYPVASTLQQGFSASHQQPPLDEFPKDELAEFLHSVDLDNSFHVDEVLKKSDFEITQKVSLVDSLGKSRGPFVRKYLTRDVGLGAVYVELYKAQQSGISFKHIPNIYECYYLKDQLVVVMEYVQGETLQEVVYRCDPSVELARDVFPRMCEAVQELHEKFTPPIIHRDLKPSNLIMSFNRLTLIDFGIARLYNDESEGDTVRFGTREYAPPEQFGYGQTDVRSDVYALGMLLFFCLTEKVADAKIRRSGFAYKGIPEPLRCVIAKATSFDPKDRYASVAELKQAFVQACNLSDVVGDAVSEAAMSRISSSVLQRAFPPPAGPPVAPAFSDESACATSPSMTESFTNSNNMGSVMQTAKNMHRAKKKLFAQNHDEAFTLRVVHKESLIRIGRWWCDHVPNWLGIFWNVAVLATWLLIMVVTVVSIVNPTPADAQLPLGFRVLEYGSIVGLSCTSIMYVLLDKRRLFARFPRLKVCDFPMRVLIFGIAIPMLLFFVVVVVVVACFGGSPPS
ncbi:MAG: serine/threonine protein kinase [Eggerthellaceae bacterium]